MDYTARIVDFASQKPTRGRDLERYTREGKPQVPGMYESCTIMVLPCWRLIEFNAAKEFQSFCQKQAKNLGL